MKLKQIKNGFLILVLAAASFVALLPSQSAQAYTCPGKDSNGLSYVYENGRCYQVVYTNTAKTNTGGCRTGSEQHSDGKCYSRSLKSDGAPLPTNDDGSAVKNWRCSDSSAHYNGTDCVATTTCPAGRSGGGSCEKKTGYQIPNDEEVARKAAKDSFINDCKNKGYTAERCAAMATNVENNCAEDAGNAAETTKCLADEGKKLTQADPNDPANTACDNNGGWAANGKCKDGTTPGANNNNKIQGATGECGKVKTNIVSCDSGSSGIQSIGAILKQIITILTVIVGIVAVGGIAYAAIMYAGASDNASQTQNAMHLIRNIVIGILLYGFMIAIINWLVPGGIIQ